MSTTPDEQLIDLGFDSDVWNFQQVSLLFKLNKLQ